MVVLRLRTLACCAFFSLLQILFLPAFCGITAESTAWAAEPPVSAQKPAPKVLAGPAEVYFEPVDAREQHSALFRSHGLGLAASLEQNTVRLLLPANRGVGGASAGPASIQLRFSGGSPQARVEGLQRLPGISNYFFGSDPKQWRTKVPHFARIAYRGVYPGVDLVFYGESGRLEYDYVLAPGADPSHLHLEIEGAQLSLSPEGEVIVAAGGREVMRLKKPKAFQDSQPQRLVAADYVLKGNEVAVRLGMYDHHRQLVVDPALAFATFLIADCGTADPCGSTVGPMAVDSTGIYLIGSTSASVFPSITGQPPATNTHNPFTFVLKLDPTGAKVLYLSFFPHAEFEALAVDSNGQAVVTGLAGDQPAGFPTYPLTAGSYSDHFPLVCQGCDTPLVTKLSSDGARLIFSTLLIQDGGDRNNQRQPDGAPMGGIALDSQGAVYVTGTLVQGSGGTTLKPFPTTPGAFQTSPPATKLQGNNYVLKLNPTGSALGYSTYVGGQGGSLGTFGIAVDAAGAAYLTGSGKSDFPVTPGAFQTTAPGGSAGVAFKLSPDGSTLAYSTFFGDQTTFPISIAVPASNEAVIAGTGATVPTTPGAICGTGTASQKRAFATKFNSTGSALVYSTTLCNVANASTQAAAMALDASGSAYVLAGADFNDPAPSLFPLMNPIQSYLPPSLLTTALFKLDPAGALQFGTLFGDFDFSGGTGSMAVDGAGAVYFLGVGDAGTPMTPNALRQVAPDEFFHGTYLAKILSSLGAPVPVLRTTLDLGNVVFGTSSSPNDAIIGNFGDATLPAPTASITGDFSETSACQNPVPAAGKCAFTVTFTPTAAGLRTGVLTVHFSGLPDQRMALFGTGLAPTATPSSTKITFPPQFPLNTTSAPQQLKITNNGTFALNVSNIQTTGDFAQTNTCSSVAIGAFCLVQITFTPTGAGIRNGTLTLTDNAVDSPQTITLVGFGGQSAAVSFSPQNVAFAGQNVGTTSAATSVTVTNVGNQPLNVASIAASGDFSQTNNCSAVAAGNNCTVQVSFAPTTTGSRNGTVTITSNSYSSPDTISLSGTGLDFTPTPIGPTTVTVAAGQTANFGLNIAPVSGFNGTLNFTCTGTPLAATCSVSPSSISLAATAQTINISVSTTAPSAAVSAPLAPRGTPNGGIALAAGLVTLLALTLRARRRVRWVALAPLALMLLWLGCGGGSSGGGGSQGTPKGTYTIVVTGTSSSSSLHHSQNFTLVVN
jgi:hypothetical protein